MLLVTELYADPSRRRLDEFLECVRRNAANPHVEEIHLFVESAPPGGAVPTDPKVRVIPHGRRVTYRELFEYAADHLRGRRVVLANADVYFDHTLARLDGHDLAGRLLCLSRWDVQADGSARFFDHPASQDAWIFDAPLDPFPCDFPLGVPGCDNRLAWEAEQAGLAISNPSRSVRALHLHLSGVRRYEERQRLHGPVATVPADFLGIPWLWLVVPCMGRLADVRRTAPSLLSQPRATYALVDYSCPDGAARWAREHEPAIEVVEVTGRARFRGADARNRGAACADDDGVLCFLDAATGAAPGFADHVLTAIGDGAFLVPDGKGPGLDSAIVCRKSDFDRVGGFDDALLDWGDERADLEAALQAAGLAARTFPASLLAPLPRRAANGSEFAAIPDRKAVRAVHRSYRRAKAAVLAETGGAPLSAAARREIYRTVARRRLNGHGPTLDLPSASVAFSESMGYAVATLEVGVSSHTNLSRPFSVVPEPLRGLRFTQVVASCISPVEVSFLEPGRLFVLVGNDWDGSSVAREWLAREGFDERLPLAETQSGAGFEVWSLVGDEGERFVVPTQVMLAAAELVRR